MTTVIKELNLPKRIEKKLLAGAWPNTLGEHAYDVFVWSAYFQTFQKEIDNKFHLAPDFVKDNEVLALILLGSGKSSVYKHLSERLRKEKYLLMVAMNVDASCYEHALEEARDNVHAVLKYIEKDYRKIYRLPSRWMGVAEVQKFLFESEPTFVFFRKKPEELTVEEFLKFSKLSGFESMYLMSPPHIKESEDVVHLLIEKNPDYFKFVPSSLHSSVTKENEGMILYAIEKSFSNYYFLSNEVRSNPLVIDKFLKEIKSKNISTFETADFYKSLSLDAQKSLQVIKSLLTFDKSFIEFLPEDVKSNSEIVSLLFFNGDISWGKLPDSIKYNVDFALKAISEKKVKFESYSSSSLMSNEQFIRGFIRQNPENLQHFQNSLVAEDVEFMLEIIKINRDCISYASESVKRNHDFIKTALKSKINVFASVRDIYKNHREICLLAVACDSSEMQYVSDMYKNDREFVLSAIRSNTDSKTILRFASEDVRGDPQVCYEAYCVNAQSYGEFSYEIKKQLNATNQTVFGDSPIEQLRKLIFSKDGFVYDVNEKKDSEFIREKDEYSQDYDDDALM